MVKCCINLYEHVRLSLPERYRQWLHHYEFIDIRRKFLDQLEHHKNEKAKPWGCLECQLLIIQLKSSITAKHRPYGGVEDLKVVGHFANVHAHDHGSAAIVLIRSTGPVEV